MHLYFISDRLIQLQLKLELSLIEIRSFPDQAAEMLSENFIFVMKALHML